MSVSIAVEMDVVVKFKIVSYYPATVIENQTKLMRKINEALSEAGKDMDFLPSPASVAITGK